MNRYVAEIHSNRDLILALARLELLNRYRRSVVGVIWALLIPLSMTILMSLVLQRFFNQPFREYSFHVFTGVVVWDFFTQSILTCASAISGSGHIMKQVHLPVALYAIKSFGALFVSFLIAMAGCVLWVIFWAPELFGFNLILVVINCAVIGLCLLPVAICSSIFGLLLKDYPQAMQIVMQALYFVTPVFLLKTAFQGQYLSKWNYINPVSNLLELIRAPLMEGHLPTASNYLVSIGFGILALIFAGLLLKRYEKYLVFYV